MRAEPFKNTSHLREVKNTFAEYLQEILDANGHVRDTISRRPKSGDQITPMMNEVRALTFDERRNFYRVERIDQQRAWYVSKVKLNRRHFVAWIVFCVTVQSSAIILALARASNPEILSIWPMEPLLVAASAAIGWIQIKKFNELASAYSLTAHEIGIIQTRIQDVETDDDFSDFVNEAELAFSREHTQWVARQHE
ncbi:hypothetical protein GCM10011360_16650 [Primorskyibacter flagellatus]|uniref:SMODS and SLOG-associating 2TM effector domain-containing protein n=2 Tax=Primorskyibacter flagellatus TaxID=1387277 RepID=A0A917A6P1_9RHOB|nr:hypothetical protein GCM10011360_16650 [Primorskyibacter flagellatus]